MKYQPAGHEDDVEDWDGDQPSQKAWKRKNRGPLDKVFESEEEDRVVFFSGLVESAHLFTHLLLRTMEQDKERFVSLWLSFSVMFLKVVEVIGKGSYGVLCAAVDTHTRRN
ncbi:hypothetical protein YC2023_094157 [Brassica napus]